MYFKNKKSIDELIKIASTPSIWLDLDGVLVDFDRGFREITNMNPQEFIDEYGKDIFWQVLPEYPRFFRDLVWTEDGEELWNYLKQYNPTILSAPARKDTMPHCEEDKKTWVKNNIGDVKVVIDSNKGQYAKEGDILIDDREKNIEAWETNGGIGILHTSTKNTLDKLKEFL